MLYYKDAWLIMKVALEQKLRLLVTHGGSYKAMEKNPLNP
jgi:hypothetical protein